MDSVVELHDAPEPEIGAPLPTLICDEGHLLLAYLTPVRVPAWDGTNPTMVSPESKGLVACVRFTWPLAHMFGPPNDEAFSGHPLAERGLHPYAVFEVQNSSWIRNLERMNSVHPSHNRAIFEGRRHLVFAFHDSTFECIADGFEVEVLRGSMRSTLSHMARLLCEVPG